MKRRIYDILEMVDPSDKTGRFIHIFIMILILTNVLAVILESVGPLRTQYRPLFLRFEFFSVIIFTIEYLLRIWSCTVDPRYRSPFVGRLKFALSPLALIDLLAIAPFYIPLASADLRVVRVMRLFRFARLLKFGRYSEAFRLLGAVIRDKREELIATFTVLVSLLLIASSVIYEAERNAQPDEFSSIPAAMWWAVVTLTTVGYGDVVPGTDLGRLIGAIIAVLGIGMIALPTGIIGAGFVEAVQARKTGGTICPHCGKRIEAM